MIPNWLNKIFSYKVAPPQQAWVNIANKLDKENDTIAVNLQTKMQAHEVAPPATALSNIFAAIDQDEIATTPAFIEKIKTYTEAAPATAWNNIAAILDKEETKVVPIGKNKRAIYLRIAVAAAVIAITLLAILPLTKKLQQGSKEVAAATPKNTTEQAAPTTAETTTVTAATQKINPISPALTIKQVKETNSKQPANSNLQDYVKGNPVVDLVQDPTGSNKEKLQNSKGEIPMDIALMNTPNTYISITGADGQTVKVSSKFSNLISYFKEGEPDTKENLEIIIEENAKWRKTFDEWRYKMTNNAVALSLSNFMDIIELSKILEEKNN